MPTIVPLPRIANAAVEGLLDRAFGPERRTRTAYRIREGAAWIPSLSFAALLDGSLAGTLQCWPVGLTGHADSCIPLIMVGPVAVEPRHQQAGVGTALMTHALAEADASPVFAETPMMMIGDPGYYQRFGFDAARTAGWQLPGSFEPRRLLARGGNIPDMAGMVGPRLLEPL